MLQFIYSVALSWELVLWMDRIVVGNFGGVLLVKYLTFGMLFSATAAGVCHVDTAPFS